jgi:hypothetical protein
MTQSNDAFLIAKEVILYGDWGRIYPSLIYDIRSISIDGKLS